VKIVVDSNPVEASFGRRRRAAGLRGVQMCVLDGNSYDAKCLEAGQERDDDLDACSLLTNNKAQPLLAPGNGGVHSAHQKVVVSLSVRARAGRWRAPAGACRRAVRGAPGQAPRGFCCFALVMLCAARRPWTRRRRAKQRVHCATSRASHCSLCSGLRADARGCGRAQRGVAQLPDLHVSDSSEAMLSGRKPPFRLLVRAVATDGRTVNIRHAVSEGFVARAPDPVPDPEPVRTRDAVSDVADRRPAVLPSAAAGRARCARHSNPAFSPHSLRL